VPRTVPTVERNWLVRTRFLLLTALSIEMAVLLVTGIALFFVYRPSVAQAWPDLANEAYLDVQVSLALRLVHQLASSLALLTAVAAGIALALRPAGGRRWAGPALGAGMAVVTLLASFTGYLLPWDQLALWAVRVGTRIQGYTPLFGSDVRFVLLGGTEVTPGTVLWWLFVHAVVLGPLLLALLVLAMRRRRVAEG
jgi:quinol-cytochrome oxidoreductase complex cytochrome b subunit